MSKLKKLLKKITAKPTPCDLKFSEIDYILVRHDFQQSQPTGGSSHYIYTHKKHKYLQITIPRHGNDAADIKAVYIINVSKLIEKVTSIEGECIENDK